MNYVNDDLIEYIGINDTIDDYYYKGTEKILQNTLDVSMNLNNPICEITQVYVTCDILSYNIVKGFNSNTLDNSEVVENICFIQGVLNLSLQYFEQNSNSNLSICNESQYFSTFISLPDNIMILNDISIKAYITDIKITRITNFQIYYYINTFITLNSY